MARAKKPPERFTISALLRDSIESRGMSCYELGQMSGINPSVISRFLAGTRGLTLASADALIDALGVKYAEVGGRAKPKGKPRS